MFASVRTGGKQYRVGVGDQITVERIAGDVGAEIELDDVLALGGDETPVIGKPTVPDAAVRARILQQPRGTQPIVVNQTKRKKSRREPRDRPALTTPTDQTD